MKTLDTNAMIRNALEALRADRDRIDCVIKELESLGIADSDATSDLHRRIFVIQDSLLTGRLSSFGSLGATLQELHDYVMQRSYEGVFSGFVEVFSCVTRLIVNDTIALISASHTPDWASNRYVLTRYANKTGAAS
jgi:hypothetical protein